VPISIRHLAGTEVRKTILIPVPEEFQNFFLRYLKKHCFLKISKNLYNTYSGCMYYLIV